MATRAEDRKKMLQGFSNKPNCLGQVQKISQKYYKTKQMKTLRLTTRLMIAFVASISTVVVSITDKTLWNTASVLALEHRLRTGPGC